MSAESRAAVKHLLAAVHWLSRHKLRLALPVWGYKEGLPPVALAASVAA